MRHSISVANEQGICDSGRYNAVLSGNGRMLALAAAFEMEECPDAIYTSNLRRARETARICAWVLQQKFGRKIPVIVARGLRAQDDGLVEGFSYDSSTYKLLKQFEAAAIGKEDSRHAARRQLPAFARIIESSTGKGYRNVLVVTHSDVIYRFLHATDYMSPEGAEPLMNCQQLGPFDSHDIAPKISAFMETLKNPQAPPRKKPRIIEPPTP